MSKKNGFRELFITRASSWQRGGGHSGVESQVKSVEQQVPVQFSVPSTSYLEGRPKDARSCLGSNFPQISSALVPIDDWGIPPGSTQYTRTEQNTYVLEATHRFGAAVGVRRAPRERVLDQHDTDGNEDDVRDQEAQDRPPKPLRAETY